MSTTTPEFLYVYATEREEPGTQVAVAESILGEGNRTVALFGDPLDAAEFAYMKQEKYGCMVHLLDSVMRMIE